MAKLHEGYELAGKCKVKGYAKVAQDLDQWLCPNGVYFGSGWAGEWGWLRMLRKVVGG